MTAPSTARVRSHREKLASNGCQRLEITIGTDVVEQMRTLAKRQGLPLWQVVQEACEAHWRTHADASGSGGVERS